MTPLPAGSARCDAKSDTPSAASRHWAAFVAAVGLFLRFAGPGFLVAIAYIDPGNLAVDLQAGAQFRFSLLWMLLVASVLGLLIQMLAARLGLASGKHLAEWCRDEYPCALRYGLFVCGQLSVIIADIPEVIGFAVALQLLTALPLWGGTLLCGGSVFVFLSANACGARGIELLVVALICVISVCFLVEQALSTPSAGAVLYGLFVPRVDADSMYSAISLLGANVMPHNLFLHSALVLSRKVPRNEKAIREANKYNLCECTLAIAVALVINIAVVSVSGAQLFYREDVGLQETPDLLQNALGRRLAAPLFSVALLASAQSSTLTGTFAGQFVMDGFLRVRLAGWKQTLMTRCSALVPALVVTLVAGPRGAAQLAVLTQTLLAILLPFALIPLVKFTCSPALMGPFASSRAVRVAAWSTTVVVVGANVIMVVTTLRAQFDQWTAIYSPAVIAIIAVVMTVAGAAYVLLCVYLLWRPLRPRAMPEFNAEESSSCVAAAVAEDPSRVTVVSDSQPQPSADPVPCCVHVAPALSPMPPVSPVDSGGSAARACPLLASACTDAYDHVPAAADEHERARVARELPVAPCMQ